MKKMFLILLVVLALSGVCVAYGGGNVSDTWDFHKSFSQSFRNGAIKMEYKAGYEIVTESYKTTYFAWGYLTVKMDERDGGANTITELTGTDDKMTRTAEATGIIKKDESKRYGTKATTAYLNRLYCYVDYRGVSMTPDVYTYTVTKK